MRRIRSIVEVLSTEEIASIHSASLRILDRVGFRVLHDECLAICRERGARVDADSSVVRLAPALVEDMLHRMRAELAPPGAARVNARLEGVISTQIYVIDYLSREKRLGVADDVLKGIALVHQLDNFPTSNAVVLPSDEPEAIRDVIAFKLLYSYSRKPGMTYILTPRSARYILEMAGAMERPVRCFLEPVTPLVFRNESLEMALLFTRRGQPFYVGPMVMGGATGPVTLAGILALHSAELLASIFLVYALTCGFPIRLYNSGPHTVELKNMLCSFGSPNQALLGIAVSQMERFYGLEPVCNAGLTDALLPDFQAGFEKASTAVVSFLAGATGIGCQGLVGADQAFSFEQLVIDNEWLGAVSYMLGGFAVDEETLAADVIERVGIGGAYIAEEHTRAHMRENYFSSRLFARDDWAAWLAKGSKDTLTRARDILDSFFRDYRAPEPVCTPAQFDALGEIADSARRELVA